jgi:hypothetical protein
MARVSERRSTSRGMGRVRPNTDQIATIPVMPAVLAPSEAPRSGPVPSGTRARTTGTTGTTRTTRTTRTTDERQSDAPLSRGAVELLRRTVPRVVGTSAELAGAPLDHREGFVVSLVDGKTTVQALIDLAAMPDGELIAVLQRLRHLGLISLG